jgi:hypothetical protein
MPSSSVKSAQTCSDPGSGRQRDAKIRLLRGKITTEARVIFRNIKMGKVIAAPL